MRELWSFVVACCLPALAWAQSCAPFLPAPNSIATVVLVSMNRNGVASHVESPVAYRAGAAQLGRPARLVTGAGGAAAETAPQVFSDRTSPAGVQAQRFDAGKADRVHLAVTLEASPEVTLTLSSWGGVKTAFRATCSPAGVLHGNGGDVDYLLFIKFTTVN